MCGDTTATPDLALLSTVLESIGDPSDDKLIPILQKLQETYGYLPQEVVLEASRRTGIPASRMFGVISFYGQFYTEPHGKHTIRCCRGTACYVRGGNEVVEAVSNALGIQDGDTDDGMLFSFETVACLGACALAPVMVVDETYYGKMTARRAEKLLQRLAGEGK